MNKKILIIALYGILSIHNSAFGMEPAEDSSIIITYQKIDNLQNHFPCTLYKQKPQQTKMALLAQPENRLWNGGFAIQINEKTGIGAIHLSGELVERVQLPTDLKQLSQLFKPSENSPTFFCVVKDNESLAYKVTYMTTTYQPSDLDKATKEEIKILSHDKHQQEIDSDKKLLLGIGIGVPLGMMVLGLSALYALLRILENFRYNK